MGDADLGPARWGGALGGALEQRWKSGPPRGAAGTVWPAHRRSNKGPKMPSIGRPDLANHAVND